MNDNRREFLRKGVTIGMGALWAQSHAEMLLQSSFGASGTAGDYEPVCLKSSPPAKTLLALRVEELDDRSVELLPLSCLQGLVNRQQPRVYLAYDRFDEFWLDWLCQRGDVDEVRWVGAKQLYEQFLPLVKGLVVIDPDVPGSVNVATMLASVEGWLPVAPRLSSEFGELDVAMDLRGRWKKNIEAYRWFYSNYGSQMSRRACANYDPGQFELRDYFVEFKIPLVWISHPDDAQRSPTASAAEEEQFARGLFQSLPANIPCMGWWDHGQAGENGCDENGPYSGVELVSQYGKFQICSAYDGYANGAGNLSVHSGTSASFRQKPVATPPLEDKVYCTFIRTDGDGTNFWRQVYRDLWEQPDHGKVPVGWQLGPSAYDLIPDIIDYFYQHASPNDVFVNALTGLGYIREKKYLEKLPKAEQEAAWKQYMELSDRYFKLFDLSLLTTFEAAGPQMPPETLARFTTLPDIKGIFRSYDGGLADTTVENLATELNDVPIFRAIGVDFSQGATEEVQRGLQEFLPAKRPAFIYVSLTNWMVDIHALVEIEQALGPDYVIVRPDVFAALYAEGMKGRS